MNTGTPRELERIAKLLDYTVRGIRFYDTVKLKARLCVGVIRGDTVAYRLYVRGGIVMWPDGPKRSHLAECHIDNSDADEVAAVWWWKARGSV